MHPYFSEKYYLFYFLALLSEILGTVSGFGSSVLFVPLAAYFFEFHEVLGITALFHVFSNTSKIVLFREGIQWSIVKSMGLSATLFVILGAILSKYAPVKELELFLSLFMLMISLVLLTGLQKRLNATTLNLVLGGTLSGFIAGLIGTGGAIRGITLAAFGIPKNSFIATSAVIDFGVDASRLLVYLRNGFIQTEFLYLVPVLVLISVLGTGIGKVILSYIPERIFQKIVLGVILLLAIVQVVHYFN